MPYTSHFSIADDMITHLNTIIGGVTDPFVSSRYVGFVAISAVTVYELALKNIFIDFAENKHKVFGTYTKCNFDRINGHIKSNQIKDDYITKFGTKYLNRFNRKIEEIEKHFLRTYGRSVKTAYNNLIVWRNSFAHQGQIPTYVTYNEVVSSYYLGKEMIRCVYETMQR